MISFKSGILIGTCFWVLLCSAISLSIAKMFCPVINFRLSANLNSINAYLPSSRWRTASAPVLVDHDNRKHFLRRNWIYLKISNTKTFKQESQCFIITRKIFGRNPKRCCSNRWVNNVSFLWWPDWCLGSYRRAPCLYVINNQQLFKSINIVIICLFWHITRCRNICQDCFRFCKHCTSFWHRTKIVLAQVAFLLTLSIFDISTAHVWLNKSFAIANWALSVFPLRLAGQPPRHNANFISSMTYSICMSQKNPGARTFPEAILPH